VTTLHITLESSECRFAIDDQTLVVPFGRVTLASFITTDPPLPEELTNAIGFVYDHLEDVDRELPAVVAMEHVTIAGDGIDVVAAVEVGGQAALPYPLSHEAAEDLFRTMATEAVADRRCNPGLPAEWVQPILGVCAAVAAIVRYYRLDHIELVAS
jgi:exopolyphosphatase/guanosine-5'-triphosphate,3'-diphosphate pyrophosphatase